VEIISLVGWTSSVDVGGNQTTVELGDGTMVDVAVGSGGRETTGKQEPSMKARGKIQFFFITSGAG
jgi:hypothetical protein